MDGISPPPAWSCRSTFAMFAIGGMGGGDAKLMAATSLWMGFNINLLGYLVTSAFIGGLLTLLILSYRKSPLADLTGENMFLRHFADSKVGVPYGVALGVGGLVSLPDIAAGDMGDRAAFRTLIPSNRSAARQRASDAVSQAADWLFCAGIGSICINVKLITIVRIALTVI